MRRMVGWFQASLLISALALVSLASHAASDDPYLILGVPKSATKAEIKSRYRSLAKEIRPDLPTTDKAQLARFFRIQAAYDLLSDDAARAQHDRNPTGGVSTQQETETPLHRAQRESTSREVRRFFTLDPHGIPMTAKYHSGLPLELGVTVNLEPLSLNDVLERGAEYARWQSALRKVVTYNVVLSRLALHHYTLISGSYQAGVNAHGLAQLGYLIGVIHLIGPPEYRSLTDAALWFGLSPLVWQAVGQTVAIPSIVLADHRARILTERILAAPSQNRLVNAIIAADALNTLVEGNVRSLGSPGRFERLTRGVTMKLSAMDPAVLKGFLLRELQKTTSAGRFWNDVGARPKRWTAPLRELVAELEPYPALQEQARAKLIELESQSMTTTARRYLGQKVGWTCEFVLANARAFTVKRSRWPRD